MPSDSKDNSIANQPHHVAHQHSKRIDAQAVLTYTFDGNQIELFLFFDLRGILMLIRTLKWCWFRRIPVTITYLPDAEDLTRGNAGLTN